eukprot:COSAG01_NODE_2803_length_7047_cov_19.196891_5_plen_230_part_00
MLRVGRYLRVGVFLAHLVHLVVCLGRYCEILAAAAQLRQVMLAHTSEAAVDFFGDDGTAAAAAATAAAAPADADSAAVAAAAALDSAFMQSAQAALSHEAPAISLAWPDAEPEPEPELEPEPEPEPELINGGAGSVEAALAASNQADAQPVLTRLTRHGALRAAVPVLEQQQQQQEEEELAEAAAEAAAIVERLEKALRYEAALREQGGSTEVQLTRGVDINGCIPRDD